MDNEIQIEKHVLSVGVKAILKALWETGTKGRIKNSKNPAEPRLTKSYWERHIFSNTR